MTEIQDLAVSPEKVGGWDQAPSCMGSMEEFTNAMILYWGTNNKTIAPTHLVPRPVNKRQKRLEL